MVAGLVSEGYSFETIMHARSGVLPYGGWSRPQLLFWHEKAAVARKRNQKDFISGLMLAISGSLDAKAGKAVRKLLEEPDRG